MQNEFFNLLESNEDTKMMIIMTIQEEMDREMEYILNFKRSVKARGVLTRIGSLAHGFSTRTTSTRTNIL